MYQQTQMLRVRGEEVVVGEHERADEHVGVDQIAVGDAEEARHLDVGVEHLVEAPERLHVELAQLAEQVEATLQDLFRPDVVLHQVVGDVLMKQR